MICGSICKGNRVIQATFRLCVLQVICSNGSVVEELLNFSQLSPWTFRKITCCNAKGTEISGSKTQVAEKAVITNCQSNTRRKGYTLSNISFIFSLKKCFVQMLVSSVTSLICFQYGFLEPFIGRGHIRNEAALSLFTDSYRVTLLSVSWAVLAAELSGNSPLMLYVLIVDWGLQIRL